MAVLAAVLFGVSTAPAKLLVHDLSPWMLAGLLYLGSGIGLGLFRLARGLAALQKRNERSIHGIEWFWLLVAVFAGSVAGPMPEPHTHRHRHRRLRHRHAHFPDAHHVHTH